MKACTYCGRENCDETLHCLECGTEFLADTENAKPRPSRDWSWLKYALHYVGAALLIGFFYLLSFGPVTRVCVTVTALSSNATTTGFTVSRTVQYPGWVGLVYHPAMQLSFGNSGFADLYRLYLEKWERTPTQK